MAKDPSYSSTPERSVEEDQGYLVPNWDQRGIMDEGYAIQQNYDDASKYVDNELQSFLQGTTRFSMSSIAPGGTYEFGSGTLSAPGIRWAADTDSGFYLPAVADMAAVIGGIAITDWTATGFTVATGLGLKALGWANIGTTTDANAVGQLAAGVTGSGRLHFFRRYAGDGLINDGGATELLDGALTIYGVAAGERLDISTYSAGHTIGFRNPYGQLEFHTNLGGGWQPIMLLGGYATHSGVEIRNVADTDCIYLQFHTTSGPAIMTQVYTQLDFGVALTRNVRLTATDLSPITTGAVSLGTVSKVWGDGYFGTKVVIGTSEATITGENKLSIYSTGPAYILFRDTTNDIESFCGVSTSGSNSAVFGSATNHPIIFYSNNTARWVIGATGHLLGNTNNTYDIGDGTNNPRTGYFGTSLVIGATQHTFAAASVVINETQADCDFRIEGDSASHMFFLDATSTTENIALLTTAAPNWQTGDKILFIGDADTVPTGNPTSGGFLFSEGGALKWRGSGGTVTTIGPS